MSVEEKIQEIRKRLAGKEKEVVVKIMTKESIEYGLVKKADNNEKIIFNDGRVVVRNQIIKIETPSLSELIDIVRDLQDMGNHLLNRL